MISSAYIKAGNEFFEKNLKNYRRLGLSYNDFWEKGFNDYIHRQQGHSDQTIQHCKDVENNVWLLIRKKEYIRYFPLEILYILSLSCALHDCAKTGDNTDHAKEGAKIIKEELVKKGYVNKQSVADVISYIVSVHHSGNLSSLSEELDIGANIPIRVKDCAAIFRLADMMSTTEERALRIPLLVNLSEDNLTQFLNRVRLSIQSCQPSKSDRTCIEVRYYTEDVQTKQDIELYVEGLNKDLTEEHRKVLQNIKVPYLKKYTPEEKEITLPYKFIPFALSSFWEVLLTHRNEISMIIRKIPSSKRKSSGLVPCYFVTNETNIDIYGELLEKIETEKFIDSKFLYWSLRGTKEYLSLCRNPNYLLSHVAHKLLEKGFRTQIYPVIRSSDKKLQQVIDLGVGDGQEMIVILNTLLSDKTNRPKIHCSLIDFSYHMLRIAVATLNIAFFQKEQYKNRLKFFAINGDFRNLNLYRDILRSTNGSRLFCLLGGTLGNFSESEVLVAINKEMSAQDFLLLGVDLLGGRSDEELLKAYDSIYNKKFLFNPLADLGFNFNQSTFKCEIKDNVSEVPNSKTVTSWFSINGANVQIAKSTKYDPTNLKDYLKKFKFYVLKDIINDNRNYALFLMTKK